MAWPGGEQATRAPEAGFTHVASRLSGWSSRLRGMRPIAVVGADEATDIVQSLRDMAQTALSGSSR